MNWLDILDYPDDFAVHKPTNYPWVTEINISGLVRGDDLRACLNRKRLRSTPMRDHRGHVLKIRRVDYIKKVIYLALA